MAAPSYVSSVVSANNTTSPKTLNAGTRAVGDLVVVTVGQSISGEAASHSVTDSLGNTYTRLVGRTGVVNRREELWYSVLTVGGACTASVSQAAGTNFACSAAWATPASGMAIALDAFAEAEDAATLSHICAPTGDIDTAADVIVFATGLTGGNSGTLTNPTGFTLRQTTIANRAFLWSYESTGALANEQAIWGTANMVASMGAVASFKTIAGGGSFVDNTQHILNCIFASA